MGLGLRELLAVFDIEVHSEELEHFDKEVKGLVGRVQKAGELFAEAFAIREVAEFFKAQIEMGARLGDLSERLGVATDDLQAFQYAASLAGVEGEQAAHSLGLLNKNVGEAVTAGGEAAQTFAKLKVATKAADGSVRPISEILGDVADSFQSLPDQQTRAAYAMKLFGREGQALLPMLQEGREGLEANRREFEELGGGMSKDFIKAAKRTDDELRRLKWGFTSIKVVIAGAALPYINRAVRWFINLAREANNLAKHSYAFQTALAFLAGAGVLKLIFTLGKLLSVFGLLKPSIGETLVALFKFGWPIALVAALYLIFDDLYTLIQGGQSAIGDFLDSMFGVGASAAFVVYLKEAWADTIRVLGDLATIVWTLVEGPFEALYDIIRTIAKSIDDLAHGNFSAIGANFKKLTDQFGNIGVKAISAGADIGQTFTGGHMIDDMTKAILDARAKASGTYAANVPASTVAPGVAASGAGGTVHQANEINVTVTGDGKNPKQLGAAVGQGVATELEKEKHNALHALQGM